MPRGATMQAMNDGAPMPGEDDYTRADRKPGMLPKALAVLREEIDELGSAIESLLKLVEPVLTEDRPTAVPVNGEAKADTRGSYLREELMKFSDDIQAYTSKVRRHIDRVDL